MNERGLGCDWDDFRYVLALARHGSLSSAARSLRVDHTTVSRRLERVARSLNAKIFERSPDGFVPTPLGETLISIGEQFEGVLLRSESEMGQAGERLSGSVCVAAPDGVGIHFLAPRLASFSALHPGLRIQLSTSAQPISLAQREADILITLDKPLSGRVAVRKLVDFHMALYAGRTFVDDRGMPGSLERVGEFPLVGYIPGLTHSPTLDFLPELPGAPQASFSANSVSAQITAVKAGAGIAILPSFLAETDPELVPVLEGEFHLERTFSLVVHEDNRRLPRVQAVSDFICSEMRRRKADFKLSGLAAT